MRTRRCLHLCSVSGAGRTNKPALTVGRYSDFLCEAVILFGVEDMTETTKRGRDR